MNKHLQDLILLSDIYKRIKAFEPEIKRIKTDYDSLVKDKKRLVNKRNVLVDEINELSSSINSNNTNLEEVTAKLNNNETRLKDVKSDRELRSIQLENDIAKEQVEFLNDEINRMELIKEKKEQEMSNYDLEFDELNKSLSKEEKSYQENMENINEEKEVIFKEKHNLTIKMNPKTLQFYEKIKQWADDTTLVSIDNGACNGCFLKLPRNVISTVMTNENIVNCPNCGRILYNADKTK